MTRSADPLSGVPDNGRYGGGHGEGISPRYQVPVGDQRGPAGSYEWKPVTLEEEADARGWIPGAMPTGPYAPMGLYTLGMRGEPGYDDDPSAKPNGVGYVQHDGSMGRDISSWD